MGDEPEGRGAKVSKEFGRESSQLTMPHLIPMVPSTSQQADTADSVASMARKREGASSSAGVDQWTMLGLGQDQKTEEKEKQGQGKGEDKGKLSPRRMVQPGVASSAGFIWVTPPLSPHVGGTTVGSVPAGGGAGGHVKLEAPAKFTGKGFPIVWDWLEETANWLKLFPCTPDQWINIAGTRLEKGASSWFRAEKVQIAAGQRAPWAD